MIFKDLLIKFSPELHSEFKSILKQCYVNQFHEGDLLLWRENGFYYDVLGQYKPADGRRLNPHVIGPGIPGHSELTHYEFIHQYRTSNIYEFSHEEYLEKVKYSPERIKEIDELISFESISIQIEMLIYLKIWESDLTIKRLYELARILNGESYDWYFKIAESSRPKSATGNRQDILRKKVRDRFTTKSPVLSDWISCTYKTQIRNSISHSNYSITGRIINLNNFINDDPYAQLHSLSFDEWHEIFHKSLILHNELIWLGNTINDDYAKKAQAGEKIEVLITEKEGKQYTFELDYRSEYDDWNYKKN